MRCSLSCQVWTAPEFKEFMKSKWLLDKRTDYVKKQVIKESASDRRKHWWIRKLDAINKKRDAKAEQRLALEDLFQTCFHKDFCTSNFI